jgi:hypothetical protein
MIKQALGLVAALAMVGCASESGSTPQAQSNSNGNAPMMAGQSGPTQAELAAYAGAHQYPSGQQPENHLRAAVVVMPDQSALKIYNFGSDPITDADIWVNQAFVRHVNAIAPSSSITIQASNLYNSLGQQFSSTGQHVNSVQIQQGKSLESVMGPVTQ